MRRPAPSAALVPAPRQLWIPFDPWPLRGINVTDRETALSRLTHLLLEAASVAMQERDDDER